MYLLASAPLARRESVTETSAGIGTWTACAPGSPREPSGGGSLFVGSGEHAGDPLEEKAAWPRAGKHRIHSALRGQPPLHPVRTREGVKWRVTRPPRDLFAIGRLFSDFAQRGSAPAPKSALACPEDGGVQNAPRAGPTTLRAPLPEERRSEVNVSGNGAPRICRLLSPPAQRWSEILLAARYARDYAIIRRSLGGFVMRFGTEKVPPARSYWK